MHSQSFDLQIGGSRMLYELQYDNLYDNLYNNVQQIDGSHTRKLYLLHNTLSEN